MRETNWARLVRDDFTSLWVSCPKREIFLIARDILSFIVAVVFRNCYSLHIVCSEFLSPSRKPKTVFKRVYYVLNPVNMPNTSDKP